MWLILKRRQFGTACALREVVQSIEYRLRQRRENHLPLFSFQF